MDGDDKKIQPPSFASKSSSKLSSTMMANDHHVNTHSYMYGYDNDQFSSSSNSSSVVIVEHNHFNYSDHHSSNSGVNYLSNASYLFGTDQFSVGAVDHADKSEDDAIVEYQIVSDLRDHDGGDDDDDDDDDDDTESQDHDDV